MTAAIIIAGISTKGKLNKKKRKRMLRMQPWLEDKMDHSSQHALMQEQLHYL